MVHSILNPKEAISWEQRKIGDFAKESSIIGHNGLEAKKLTVKLHCKGVEESADSQLGSCNTRYYVRKEGQFVYGKQNFFNGAIGVVPKNLDNYESTKDVPAFDLDSTVDSKWLYFYVARPEIYKPLEAECTGTGSKRFHVDNFYLIELFTPKIKEQNQIAELFTNIDFVITLHQREVLIWNK